MYYEKHRPKQLFHILQIKEWLGHADIETTANIYTHISHDRKVSMAKGLHNMLSFAMDE